MDTRLLQQLKAWNPWWESGIEGLERFGVPTFKREAYSQISEAFFARKQAVSIVGMRQVGKTTIMHQCIRELLENGVPPKNIFFISFEDSYLLAKYDNSTLFHDVISAYSKNIIQEELSDTKKEFYFFFDEVHKIPNWAQSVKTYFDQHAPIAFMVSGSASYGLQTSKGDSLLGRMNEFTLYPFSFREALLYKLQSHNNVQQDEYDRLVRLLNSCRDAGLKMMYQNSLSELYNAVSETFRDLTLWYETHIHRMLREYVIEGGFPRVWQQTDEYSKHRHLVEQHLQKVIREDLPQIAGIRKVGELESLYIHLLERAGEEIVLSDLAKEINISQLTLSQYIRYLNKTFLLFPVERTKTKNVLRQRRASRVKFYIMDAAVRAAVLKNREDVFDNPQEMGVYAENLVASSLIRRLGGQAGNVMRYYRDGNKEVDFIVKEGESLLPIEVKWRDQVPTLTSLDAVCKKWNLNENLLITRDHELTYKNGRLSFPLWFFLLLT